MGRWHRDRSVDGALTNVSRHQVVRRRYGSCTNAAESPARGNNFGSCEIFALTGEGGMGEVYRGYDTNLSRDIAVKVLPPSGP
jgi:hypothetical protein